METWESKDLGASCLTKLSVAFRNHSHNISLSDCFRWRCKLLFSSFPIGFLQDSVLGPVCLTALLRFFSSEKSEMSTLSGVASCQTA